VCDPIGWVNHKCVKGEGYEQTGGCCPALSIKGARDSAGIVCTSFSISSPRGGGTEIFYSSWHTITGAQRGRGLVMLYLSRDLVPGARAAQIEVGCYNA